MVPDSIAKNQGILFVEVSCIAFPSVSQHRISDQWLNRLPPFWLFWPMTTTLTAYLLCMFATLSQDDSPTSTGHLQKHPSYLTTPHPSPFPDALGFFEFHQAKHHGSVRVRISAKRRPYICLVGVIRLGWAKVPISRYSLWRPREIRNLRYAHQNWWQAASTQADRSATLGARLLKSRPHSAAVGCIALAGQGFSHTVLHMLRGWDISLQVCEIPEKPATKGLLVYQDEAFGRK